jgi:F-type H+-transporting ATPase subunit gamma
MINTKAIKTRIAAVKNTQKITKAMEMIAAVKMRKSVQSTMQSKDYALLAYELFKDLSKIDYNHPLMRTVPIGEFNSNFNNLFESDIPEDTGRHLFVVITSNRGLCGSYNTKVFREMSKFVESTEIESDRIDVLAIGNKAGKFAKNLNLNLVALYNQITDVPEFEEIISISNFIKEEFTKGVYDSVTVFYTNYVSGLVQNVTVQNLLPISNSAILSISEIESEDSRENQSEYEFEPKQSTVLDYILAMLFDVLFYQCILESSASEHSSRMFAMKNASESATDILNALTLEFNKGRQAAITQEISEIVGGAAALD